eukprot:366046-Chlamydomonas_euryale.AAC.5
MCCGRQASLACESCGDAARTSPRLPRPRFSAAPPRPCGGCAAPTESRLADWVGVARRWACGYASTKPTTKCASLCTSTRVARPLRLPHQGTAGARGATAGGPPSRMMHQRAPLARKRVRILGLAGPPWVG